VIIGIIFINIHGYNALIQRGGGTGPMKPGNLLCKVPIPTNYFNSRDKRKVDKASSFRGSFFILFPGESKEPKRRKKNEKH